MKVFEKCLRTLIVLGVIVSFIGFNNGANAQTNASCYNHFGVFSEDYVSNVIFAGINNPTTYVGSNTNNYLTQVGNIIQGQPEPISVTIFSLYGDVDVRVFVDFNDNGILDDAGEVFTLGTQVSAGTYTSSITAPSNSHIGNVRMRVTTYYDSGYGIDPCVYDLNAYGEAEDYTINISAPTNCVAPINPGTISPISGGGVCANSSFTLNATGTSTGLGISYQWQVSPSGNPGSWTNLPGATFLSSVVSQSTANYYRLRTICNIGNDTVYSASGFVDAFTCYNMSNTTITTCNAILYDNGGPNASYTNNLNLEFKILPLAGNNITLTFNSFSTEDGYDSLSVYMGAGAMPVYFNSYDDIALPPTIISNAADGGITLKFDSDGSYTDLGFEIVIGCQPKPLNDVQLLSIDNPKKVNCSLGNSIEITMSNLGLDTLTSVDINVNSSGLVIPVSWTGSIAPGTNQQIIVPGNYSFNDGDSLSISLVNPNGVVDPSPANNVLGLRHRIALQGVYHVGYNTTIADTFATIQNAIDALVLKGICGDVYFDIKPGTYTGNYTINQYPGWNNGNRVYFRSATQNMADVTIENLPSSSSNNFVFNINGADGITLKHLTLKNTSVATNLRTVVSINNGAHYFMADSCSFFADTTYSSSGSNDGVVIKSTNYTSDNYTVITNNIIDGGIASIVLTAGGIDFEKGLVISNNTFTNYSYLAFLGEQTETPTFTKNKIVTRTYSNDNDVNGAVLNYSINGGDFSNNDIKMHVGGMGIYLYESKGAQNPFLISNNFIYSSDSVSYSGVSAIVIDGFGANNILIANNSISIKSSQLSNAGIVIYDGSGIQILNNNIGSFGNSYALKAYAQYNISESNYNNYFSPNGGLLAIGSSGYNTVANYTAATGFEAASMSVNPGFNGSDLHTCQFALNNAGNPLTNVVFDIDGEPRTNSNDIGADQFMGDASDLIVDANVTKCINASVTIGNAPVNGVTYSWSTGATSSEITTSVDGQFIVSASNSCGTFVDTVTVVNIANPTAAFQINGVGLAAILTNTSTNVLGYSWNFGDGNTSTLENPNHVYTAGGVYVITLTVYGECDTVTTTQTYNAIAVGNEEISVMDVSLYPNPATNQINLIWNNGSVNLTQLEICDMAGKVVKIVSVNDKMNAITVSLEDLQSGVYMVKFATNDNFGVLKFVKK